MANDCILHEGAINEDGYGTIGDRKAHRVAWEKKHGPIPMGFMVCHHCDNPPCINVDHLFLGTNKDNMADRNRKNRQARQRGSDNGRAILTEATVKEIKEHLREDMLSLNDLANMYGVGKSTIVHIKAGRQWSHVQ